MRRCASGQTAPLISAVESDRRRRSWPAWPPHRARPCRPTGGRTLTEIEEAIWDWLHFATHLRSQRLGGYTIGMDLHRSESLALVQPLIVYHLVTGRAAGALGREELERAAV
jgi:hypothetical protein